MKMVLVCQFFYMRALKNYDTLSRLQGSQKKITQIPNIFSIFIIGVIL